MRVEVLNAENDSPIAGYSREDCQVAAAVAGKALISWKGSHSIVTRSEGQVIIEIDGRPAEDVYLENLGRGGEQMSEEEFAALAITHPLAQPELHGNRRLRHILGRAQGGGLVCATHIPPNAGIEFTVLGLDELLRSGWESVSASIEGLGDKAPRAALVFDCAGRRRVLGDAQDQEVRAISDSYTGMERSVAILMIESRVMPASGQADSGGVSRAPSRTRNTFSPLASAT